MNYCFYAGTYLDEDVWQEVQEYRKSLVKMFRFFPNLVFLNIVCGGGRRGRGSTMQFLS
jgi:hypothetical protein